MLLLLLSNIHQDKWTTLPSPFMASLRVCAADSALKCGFAVICTQHTCRQIKNYSRHHAAAIGSPKKWRWRVHRVWSASHELPSPNDAFGSYLLLFYGHALYLYVASPEGGTSRNRFPASAPIERDTVLVVRSILSNCYANRCRTRLEHRMTSLPIRCPTKQMTLPVQVKNHTQAEWRRYVT